MSAQRLPLLMRVRIAVMTVVVRVLKALGLRERVVNGRIMRARKARATVGPEHPLAAPALHGMDRKLNAILDQDGGFFVEAGGNDGYTQSNTYWLQRYRGWTGLLVEPMQELYELCRQERSGATVVRAALVPFDHDGDTVRMRFADLMSTVAGPHENEFHTELGRAVPWRDAYDADVPARTLSSILDEIQAPEIDLLSLDVEGFEPGVLAGLDFERHAPRWIAIEVHDDAGTKEPIEALFGDRYVMHERISPTDLLYRRVDVTA
ncbi:MAG: FkbM family methyltransferase [Solirubrobacteraceae bacterium]|nr:FkbM family methyltransferase [Solirubrobacteraceae bacterium]